MGRPKSKPHEVRSRVAGIRLREEEWGGLAQLAETLGETPSRIIRRLIREAINGGPDYFEDGAGEIRRMRYELTRIGRNLNQFARAVNRGERVMSADLRRAFNACTVQLEAVRLVYSHAVEAAATRAWRPLYRDGGGRGLSASRRSPRMVRSGAPGRRRDPEHSRANRNKMPLGSGNTGADLQDRAGESRLAL